MPSPFASYFNDAARPMLLASHAETLVLQTSGGDVDLDGVWKRVMPEGGGQSDGVGMTGYTGEAMFVVLVADLPDLPGSEALIVRNGEEWAIRHGERKTWSWILHLSRREADVRMPARMRKQ